MPKEQKIYLPFRRMAEAICAYTNNEDEQLNLLSEFNLPKDRQVIEIVKPNIEAAKDKYSQVHSYIKNLTSKNSYLDKAIELHKNPYVANCIKSAILLNMSPKEITGFDIKNDIMVYFKMYFFDIEKTDLISWQTYLNLLPAYDKELLSNAQAQNKDLVLVNLGKLPTDMHLIVNDLVITAYKKFKESLEENPRVARVWARIATDALVNQGNAGVDLSSKPFELILKEFDISTNPEKSPQEVGFKPFTPEEPKPEEEKDPDEIEPPKLN